MKKQTGLFLLFFFFVFLSSWPAGAQEERDIEWSQLPSGLTVITERIPGAPSVAINGYVLCGSVDENPGTVGLSHVIEHMIFKGTERRAVGEIWQEIQDVGGEIHASTGRDYTQFRVSVGRDFLDDGLDVLLDALQHSSFDPGELDRELSVIFQELNMRRDNPYYRTYDEIYSLAFKTHPYGLPIGGTVETLSRASRRDLLDLVEAYYVPNNMVIAVVGDIDHWTVIERVWDLTENWTARNLPLRRYPAESRRAGGSRVIEMDINQAYLTFAFPAPSIEEEKETYAMDILSVLLGSGRASRLNRELREDRELVYDVSAYYPTTRYPSLFLVSMELDPQNVEEARGVFLDQIRRLSQEPVSWEELSRAKEIIRASQAVDLETVGGRASSLGSAWMLGRPRYGLLYLENIMKTAPEDIQSAARTYLKLEEVNELLLLPRGKTAAFEPTRRSEEVGEAEFENGVTVLLLPNDTVDLLALDVFIGVGQREEQAAAPAGTLNYLARMISKGNAGETAERQALRLESQGISLSAGAARDYLQISGQCLSEDYDAMTDMIRAWLRDADFPPDKMEQVRREIAAEIVSRRDNPALFALEKTEELIYPAPHPYHSPLLGTPESLSRITRQDLETLRRQLLQGNRIVIVAVGRFDADLLLARIHEAFGDLPAGTVRAEVANTVPPLPQTRRETLYRDLDQAHVIVAVLIPPASDPSAVPLRVANGLLGGRPGSALWRVLREEGGMAYAVSSQYSFEREGGYWLIYAGCSPEKVSEVKAGIEWALQRAVQEMNDDEVLRLQRYLVGSFQRAHERVSAQAWYRGYYEMIGLGHAFDDAYPDAVYSVAPDEARTVLQELFINAPRVEVVLLPESAR